MIIIFEQPFAIKKPVVVLTTSMHLVLVFKMLVKQKKINKFPSVFGTYSLVAAVFENFLI